MHVKDLDQQLQLVEKKNTELEDRNVKLSSEVQDLKAGKEAVEERARYDLGMIKQDEIFVQILGPNTPVKVDDATFTKSSTASVKRTESTKQQ